MKRFLTISILLSLLAGGKVQACIGEAPTYNYYMMSVCASNAELFLDRTNKFWKEYTGGKCDTYNNSGPTVRDIATQKGDKEMLGYMDALDKYVEISDELRETWKYPTAQELAERKTTLQQLVTKSTTYRGTRLKSQYALLRMRAQMLLGQYNANIIYWTNTASKMQPSVYRDMMENIYANALLNTGKRQAACDIYAAQGDWQSIKWMTRKYRNFAGIKTVYENNPNSPTLIYLVEDFVNNVQETLDQINATEISEDLHGDSKEWIEIIGRKQISNNDVKMFLQFANNVIKEGKTQCPCLWHTAIGVITYLNGDSKAALKIMDKAVAMKGTDIMKDNARCIRLICSASVNSLSPVFEKSLTEEMRWLDSKAFSHKNPEENYLNFNNYYYRMKERLVYRTLIPRYRKEGSFEISGYLLGMMTRQGMENNDERDMEYEDDFYWNREYSTRYFAFLNKLNADSLVLYKQRLDATPANGFECYLKAHVYSDEAYYNDIIGTKMIAEGRFADAVPYLEKVPLSFMQKQNICGYMAKRNYNVARWLTKQPIKENEENNKTRLKTNQKLDFCNDMMRLQSQYNLSRIDSKERQTAAYELAVRYFQASCYGDCWYLAHYGKSVSDSARVGEKDFAKAAIGYLCESRKSSDFSMKQECLYALAFIPTEPYAAEVFAPETYGFRIVYSKSRQYFAYKELDDFAMANSWQVSRYVSACDVLKKFRKIK